MAYSFSVLFGREWVFLIRSVLYGGFQSVRKVVDSHSIESGIRKASFQNMCQDGFNFFVSLTDVILSGNLSSILFLSS